MQDSYQYQLKQLDGKYDAIINVAGGWVGGNIQSPGTFFNFLQSRFVSWFRKHDSCIIIFFHRVFQGCCNPFERVIFFLIVFRGGLLTLCGAAAANNATPGMIAYGIAKSAVHHLVKSLAAPESGLPKNVSVNAILP